MSRGTFFLSDTFTSVIEYLPYPLLQYGHPLPRSRPRVGSLSPNAGEASRKADSRRRETMNRALAPDCGVLKERALAPGSRRSAGGGQVPGRARPLPTRSFARVATMEPRRAPSSTAPGFAIVRVRSGHLRLRPAPHSASSTLGHNSPADSIPLQFTPEPFHTTCGFLSWRSPLGPPL